MGRNQFSSIFDVDIFLTVIFIYLLTLLLFVFSRFHIHLYNMDSLIACVLPYHETKVFVRVIQLLKNQRPNTPVELATWTTGEIFISKQF